MGDVVECLCSGDYFGVSAAYLLGVELGLDEPGLWDVWKALTMGWGDRLTELGKNVGGLAEELGVEGLGGDVLLDWFAGELLKGGPALGVACRVGGVFERLQSLLPKVAGLVGDERFAGFVRAAYRGGGASLSLWTL